MLQISATGMYISEDWFGAKRKRATPTREAWTPEAKGAGSRGFTSSFATWGIACEIT